MNIWKEYSMSYIKNNKASSITIIVSAFIASVFISLICGVFYNIWADEVGLIKIQEGDWQGKITGDISPQDIKIMECYPNVEKVLLLDDKEEQKKTAVLYFYRPKSIYKDMPKIAEQLSPNTGKGTYQITYHDKLLARYFIFSAEQGNKPPLILLVYLFILVTACISLILIIHNSFAVSMNARIHQLGILQSIGATPRQLRRALINEAMALCILPILSGVAAGVGLCIIFMKFMGSVAGSVRQYELVFHYNPFIFLAALAAALLTVWFSVLIPARKISRLNPLEAIRYGVEQPVRKVKSIFILSRLLGIEGELAGKSLYVRRKAFRTSTLSLTLSFLVFSSFLNLETISSISTRDTYFERYKDSWDLMVSVRGTKGKQEELLSNIRSIPGVKQCISYKKATAYTKISKDMLSDEILALGGLENLKDTGIKTVEDGYLIKVSMLILDEESFRNYYNGIDTAAGISKTTGEPGVIIVNRIWDSKNSSRMNKKMIPFIKDKDNGSLKLWKGADIQRGAKEAISVSIIAVAEKYPKIREEFPNFSLLQILPESTYKDIEKKFPISENYLNILAASDEDISKVESKLTSLLGDQYEYTLENRLKKGESDVSIRNAYKIVIGALAGLLACIGLANVFSNALGHIYQRKREFARYITIGLTPAGVKKVLISEAFILGFKPIAVSLLINIPLVLLALKASLIDSKEFIRKMPAAPIILFAVVTVSAVGFAYYLGGRKIYNADLVEAIKDDTMI